MRMAAAWSCAFLAAYAVGPSAKSGLDDAMSHGAAPAELVEGGLDAQLRRSFGTRRKALRPLRGVPCFVSWRGHGPSVESSGFGRSINPNPRAGKSLAIALTPRFVQNRLSTYCAAQTVPQSGAARRRKMLCLRPIHSSGPAIAGRIVRGIRPDGSGSCRLTGCLGDTRQAHGQSTTSRGTRTQPRALRFLWQRAGRLPSSVQKVPRGN
jgi:hypothetical protein